MVSVRVWHKTGPEQGGVVMTSAVLESVSHGAARGDGKLDALFGRCSPLWRELPNWKLSSDRPGGIRACAALGDLRHRAPERRARPPWLRLRGCGREVQRALHYNSDLSDGESRGVSHGATGRGHASHLEPAASEQITSGHQGWLSAGCTVGRQLNGSGGTCFFLRVGLRSAVVI